MSSMLEAKGRDWSLVTRHMLTNDGVETLIVLFAPPTALAMPVDVARLLSEALDTAADQIDGGNPPVRRWAWDRPGFWQGLLAAAAFIALLLFLVRVSL